MMEIIRFLVVGSFLLLNPPPGDAQKLVTKIKADGTYAFAAGSNPEFYLESGDAFLQADGMFYTTKNESLKLTSSKAINGSDHVGTYTGTVFEYVAGIRRMVNQILVYNGGEFIRFTQTFPLAVAKSNVSNMEDSLSGFPSFHLKGHNGTSKLGYINMYDNMCGYSYRIDNISESVDDIRGGQRAGPLVLFDSMDNVMVLSAYSEFMAHNMMYNMSNGQVSFGVMGGATGIPVYYQIDTILYYSNEGLNRAIEGWGRVLTRRYRKSRARMETDLTINYLGYWTDNGAYYYYNTEPNTTYEQTLLDVLKYSKQQEIPYAYVQYDSWWYYKGIGDGVKNWTAMPSVFPNGSLDLYQEHGLPVAAHNRYWAADTTYAIKNNGSYNFYVEEEKAIPYDDRFWGDLLKESRKWGLIMYEQDWLDREFELMKVTHTNIQLGREWLVQMGHGAEIRGMSIQYCMALSRHLLQSVEIPVVTQARVSGDYHPGNKQWDIGVTSLFAHALNIAPFKDNFWTTSHQPGSPYSSNETNTNLQSAIATLSTGPVGPSDGHGYANKNLIMKSCRLDGLILKPSRPLTAVNEDMVKHALPSAVPKAANLEARVYSTYTDIFVHSSSGDMLMRHAIVLVTDLTTSNYQIYPKSLHLDVMGSETNHVAYVGHPGDSGSLITFDETHPLAIPTCGRSDFQMRYTAPKLKLNNSTTVAILGERNKWVPVSPQRIANVEIRDGDLIVDIEGASNEFVQFGFMVKNQVVFVNCQMHSSGKSRIFLNSRGCYGF